MDSNTSSSDYLEGLSILIPVYNADVVPLVKQLNHLLATDDRISFKEIIVYDDGSQTHWLEQNRAIESMTLVHYVELPQNVGRAAIRNMMARAARFSELLFLDCDGLPFSSDFVSRYWHQKDRGKAVYIGGRTYSSKVEMPANSLHYLVGKHREVKTAAQRQKAPFDSFMTNNLFIPKRIWASCQLPEALAGYGHEDTHWGILLKRQQVSLIHLDNAYVHKGLASNEEYLEKALHALSNLLALCSLEPEGRQVKIVRYYQQLKGMMSLLRPLKPLAHKWLLKFGGPLWVYDMYRLLELDRLSKQVLNRP